MSPNLALSPPQFTCPYNDEKENPVFLIYKEIQSGAVAKSYMRKGFLIYEEMRKYANISPYMRRPLVIYDLNYLIYEENLIFIFISVPSALPSLSCILLLCSFSFMWFAALTCPLP